MHLIKFNNQNLLFIYNKYKFWKFDNSLKGWSNICKTLYSFRIIIFNLAQNKKFNYNRSLITKYNYKLWQIVVISRNYKKN